MVLLLGVIEEWCDTYVIVKTLSMNFFIYKKEI